MSEDRNFNSPTFWKAFKGRFSGILKWSDVDTLFAHLHENPTGWHVFDMDQIPVGNNPPLSPMEPEAFRSFLQDAETLVRKHQSRPSCGAIYADNPADPAFVKIFDPMKMGTSCGTSTETLLPRWTVTRLKPEAVPVLPPAVKPGFFARIVKAAGHN